MKNINFPISEKKTGRTYTYIKRQRSLQTQKKQSYSKIGHNLLIKPQIFKTEVKAYVEAVPMDEQFIQHYIQQLKQKLNSIRNTPKKKIWKLPQNTEIFKKRRNIQVQKEKIKAKSVQRQTNNRYNTKSMSIMNQNKIKQSNKLQNFNQVRNSYKRFKEYSKVDQRRLATEKNKNRYADQDDYQQNQIYISVKKQKQNSTLRHRSNTEEVIRSTNNPARIYRHSSLKKHNIQESNENTFNNFLFNKITNDHPKKQICSHSKADCIYNPVKRLKIEEKIYSPKKIKIQDEQNPTQDKKQSNPQNCEKINDLSTINAKKQTINFLGDSCLAIKQQLKQNTTQKSDQILDFLQWKTKQLKNAFFNGKIKQKKNGLQKLSKIFPKGFFS